MKNRLIQSVIFIALGIALINQSHGQSISLLGHQQDFPGYYNPALAKNNKFSEVGVVYRSQWSDLSYPKVSTLYFRQPLKTDMSFLNFRSLGLILQNEDFQFIQRNSFSLFTSNTLFEKKGLSMGIGFGARFMLQGVNNSELTEKELLDPEIGKIANSFQVLPRVGLSGEKDGTVVGVSVDISGSDPLQTLLGYAQKRIMMKSSKVMLIPSLLYRYSPTGQSQFEGQFRTVYDRKVAFTVGYRHDFGPVAQLGFLLGAFKASYGAEVPSKGRDVLGYTQEILASYQFEIKHKKRHERDSLLKHERDSLNKLRLEKLRAERLDKMKKKKEADVAESDSVDNVPADTLVAIVDEPELEKPDMTNLKRLDDEELITFDDMPVHLKNNARVILRYIRFETDYDILKPYAYKELDKLEAYLHHHPNLFIEIQGHTDDVGTAEHNYELSERRALTVFNFLVSRGIDGDRMTIVGYGEDKPLVENDSDEARSFNRRIEVVFIRPED